MEVIRFKLMLDRILKVTQLSCLDNLSDNRMQNSWSYLEEEKIGNH